MYKILFTLAIASLSTSLFAQINVAEYERQLKAKVGETDAVEAPVATSSCGEVTTTFEDQTFSGGCLGTLVRTYTYKDNCGNTASAEQYINLTDKEKPEFIDAPKDTKAKESKIPEAASLEAIDNSGKAVDIQFNETEINGTIIRKWTATDKCGNVNEHFQRIVVIRK